MATVDWEMTGYFTFRLEPQEVSVVSGNVLRPTELSTILVSIFENFLSEPAIFSGEKIIIGGLDAVTATALINYLLKNNIEVDFPAEKPKQSNEPTLHKYTGELFG